MRKRKMKMLKKQSLKRLLPLAIIFYVVGIGLAILFTNLTSDALKEPVSLDDIDYTGNINGINVTGTVYGIYDWYCEEYDEEDTIAKEYIIDAGDYYFISLRAEYDDMNTADTLLEASTLYLNGEDDGTLLSEAQYEISGVIKSMPEDSKEFYYEYADWCGIDRDIFLPYYIDVNASQSYDVFDVVMSIIIVLLFMGIATTFIVLPLSGHYQKNIKKYIDSCPNQEFATAKVENFLSTVPLMHDMRYNHEFIYGSNEATTIFGETEKLVWAYKHIIKHKYYFITVAKSYALILGFADGTQQMAIVKKEAFADEHLANLEKLCPKTIFGYTEDLNKMYKKDLPKFLSLRYYAPEESQNISE